MDIRIIADLLVFRNTNRLSLTSHEVSVHLVRLEGAPGYRNINRLSQGIDVFRNTNRLSQGIDVFRNTKRLSQGFHVFRNVRKRFNGYR